MSTAPTPADVTRHQSARAAFFDPVRAAPGQRESLAQRRSRTRDVLHSALERTARAVGATRGRDEDLDLTLEWVDRSLERLMQAIRDYDEAIDAGDIPRPTSHRTPRLTSEGGAR